MAGELCADEVKHFRGDVLGRCKAEDGLHQQKYELAIKAGDGAMTAKNYKEAARQYELALAEKPGDVNATAKLQPPKKVRLWSFDFAPGIGAQAQRPPVFDLVGSLISVP